MIKNLTKCMMIISITVGLMGSFCLGQGINYTLESDFPYSDDIKDDVTTDLGNLTSIKEDDGTIIVRLLGVFGLDTNMDKDLKFIDYAKAIVNMALGLISFIALVMTIYTFYMIFFSENEAGVKKAKGNLVGIFIALAIIGLAWIIVSFIFWWYQSNRKENQENILSGTISMVGHNLSLDNQIYLNI